MALPLTNNAEGGSDGVTVTTGNSGGASGSAWDNPRGTNLPTFSNTHPAHGTLGYKFIQSSPVSLTTLDWNTAMGGNQTDVYGRANVYITAYPGVGQYATIFIWDLGGTGVAGAIAINETGQMLLFDSAAQTPATVACNLNAQFRVEYHFTCSPTAGLVEAKLWNTVDSSGAPDDTRTWSSRNTLTAFSAIRHGFDGSGLTANYTMYIDDVVLNSTGYPGPVVTAAVPTLRVLTGARW